MKFAVLLHGSGVYDGTEIQEAVLCLLHIREAGHSYQCVAPNVFQHHVIDHTQGKEMPETRNVLVESSRIARGDILDLEKVSANDYDALVMPGGFGTAKNITRWAFEGPDSGIHEPTAAFIRQFVEAGKPICALCMSPTTLAVALKPTNRQALLTVGTPDEPSPYDIAAISAGMEKLGAKTEAHGVNSLAVDPVLRIVTAPCYMMEADIAQVSANIRRAITETIALAQG